MKVKKHLEKVLNAEIWREEEHEDNRLNSELIIPIHDMGDVTASSLPNNIPDNVKEDIILNARRLVDNKLVRKTLNTSEYEVSRDHISKVLTLSFTKRGIIGCKSSECLHYTMFKVCSHCLAVAAFTNTLDKLLSESFKKVTPVSYTDTAKHDHPTGSGTKQGYKRKRKSNKRKETTTKQAVSAVSNKINDTVTQVPQPEKTKNSRSYISSSSKAAKIASKSSKNCQRNPSENGSTWAITES